MNKLVKTILLFAMTAVIIPTAVLAYFNVSYANKIFPNVAIDGVSYAGLTKSQALDKLNRVIKDKYSKGFTFKYQNKTYKAGIFKVGAEIDTNGTVLNALAYGHRNNLYQSLKEQIALINSGVDFKVKAKINESTLEKYIEEEMSEIETPAENFSYEYRKGKFFPVPAKLGTMIDRAKAKEDILNNLSNLKNDVINIKLIEKEPLVKGDLNNNALAQAQDILSKKVVLKYNSNVWEVEEEDLALWIDFAPSKKGVLSVKANRERIEDYLLSLVPQINREPINAQLEFKNGKVDVFFLGQEGIALDVKKSAEKIDKSIFYKESPNQSGSAKNNIEVSLVVEKRKPDITIEDITDMGITTLLATGESNFAGSPKNRRHNIKVGAAKFHGVLIAPQEEFSFNKILGKVGPKEGYLPELVIKKGKTIPEYGGGLCQVSTTAFRAAVKAGLEITERKNHAYPVKYYNPQGTDATIYPPHPDLRFKNNTPAYILIQTRVEGNKLYFDLYGSDDGRKVVLKGPYVYDKKRDGSMKAKWIQEVYDKNNKLMFKKTFYSNYKSPSLYPHKNPLE